MGTRIFINKYVTKLRIVKIAAVLHILLVICGAFKLTHIYENIRGGQVIACYQYYSGSSAGYGFFAPGVAAQRQVLLQGYDPSKNVWIEDSESGESREIHLRLSTMAGLFSQDGNNEILAASWAAWMFGKHPETSLSIVEVQAYLIPTMPEFRNGARPHWEALEIYSFSRKDE